MPFGMRNSPTTFQRLVDNTFRDIIDRYVKVYIDDILCYSTTWEEQIRQVQEILRRLAKHGLKASLEKTEWGVLRFGYLRFILSKNSVDGQG